MQSEKQFHKASTGTVNKRRKKYREKDKNLVRPVNEHDPENPINFSMSIAHMTNVLII